MSKSDILIITKVVQDILFIQLKITVLTTIFIEYVTVVAIAAPTTPYFGTKTIFKPTLRIVRKTAT